MTAPRPQEDERAALAVALDRLAFYMSAALSGEVPDDETVSEDQAFAREARALAAGVGFRPALDVDLLAEALDEALAQTVGERPRGWPALQRPYGRLLCEAIAREYAALAAKPQAGG